jgi:penicillin-binding protein 1A
MKKRNIIIYISLFMMIFSPFFYIIYAYNVSYNLFRKSENIRQPLATAIFDRNGQLISRLYDEYRNYVKMEEIPETVIKSFLAAEDSSFFMHTGFDIAGITRALFIDIVTGELRQGGSTITQQLAKQLFAGKEKSVKRKLVELFLAREFEKKFNKNQILEMYLNQIYLGHGVYGVSAAAEFYFQKPLKDVDVIEASLIAGIPSAPDRFSPLKNPSAAYNRSLGILFNLISSGYIEKKDAADKFNSFWERYSERIKTEFPEAGIRKESGGEARWFTEYIRRELISKYGEDEVYRGGLKVYTTLDLGYQKAAEVILERSLEKHNLYSSSINRYEISKIDVEIAVKSAEREKIRSDIKNEYIRQSVKFNREMLAAIADELLLTSIITGSEMPAGAITKHIESCENLFRQSKAEGALVALDPSSGGILAMVGGSTFNPINQLNRAVQSRRQPGSAFKAFVYGAAIEGKNITAATPFQDSPLTYRGGKNSWTPSNYDKDYSGRVLTRKALSLSLNIVSAKIYDIAGGENIAKFASKLTDVEYRRFQLDPTLSLGTTELTPLEMAKGFAVYANKGISVPVTSITKIEDRYGKNILSVSEKSKSSRAVSEQTAFIMTSMMKDVVDSGTASYAIRKDAGFRLPCAGKTGTNTDFRDAWFIGYTPDIAAAVWVGCESPRYSLGGGQSGASVSAPIWGLFMNEVYKTRVKTAFPGKPSGISERIICSISGDLADKGCPGRREYFIPGTEPGAKCDGLHGRLSNIKELIIRDKKNMRSKNAPKLFEKNEEEPDEKKTENNSEQSFFFDD